MLAGRVDYTLSTLIEASGLQQKHPDIQMILTDQARSALPMSFLAPIDDPIWVQYLNTWVYLKKTAGFFDALGQKWQVVTKK